MSTPSSTAYPLVSVLLPVYNQRASILFTLRSVLKQTYAPMEILILDDASTDGTDQLVRVYLASLPFSSEKKIIFSRNTKNLSGGLGPTKNLNCGLERARGTFIARIDGDDQWVHPAQLEKQIRFLLEHPDYGLVGGGLREERVDGSTRVYLQPETDAEIRNRMLIENPFWHGGIVFRKDALPHLRYNESLLRAQDYELWLRIGEKWKMHNFPSVFISHHDFSQGVKRMVRLKDISRQLALIRMYRHVYPHAHGALIFRLFKIFRTLLPTSLRRLLSEIVLGISASKRNLSFARPDIPTVLHIVNQSHFGGTQEYMLSLARHQSELGNRVIIAAGETLDDTFLMNIVGIPGAQFCHLKKTTARFRPLYEWRAYREIKSTLLISRPRIIHVHSPKLNILTALANKHIRTLTPIVYTIHGFWLNEPNTRMKYLLHYLLEWVGIRLVDAVIGVCQKDIADAYRQNVIPQNQFVRVIPPAVEPARISFQSNHQAREFLGNLIGKPLKPQTQIIGVISNLYPVKGIEFFLNAFSRLPVPTAIAIIIGTGPLFQKIKTCIHELGIQDRVFLVGHLPRASQYAPGFNLLVLPSIKEGMPLTLLEAAAYGIPVVASNVGGIPEITEPNWILVPPGNVASLTDAMRQGLTLAKKTSKKPDELVKRFQTFLTDIDVVYTTVRAKKNDNRINKK